MVSAKGMWWGTMRHHGVSTLFAAVAVGALGVAACSGSGSDDDGWAISPIEVPASDGVGGEATAAAAALDADVEVAADPDGGADGAGADATGAAGDATGAAGDAARGDPRSGTEGDGAAGDHQAGAEVEIDVTVIPEQITPEYVEAVLAELERLYAGSLRAFMEAGEPTLDVTAQLGSAFVEEQYRPRLQQFLDLLEDGFPGIADADELGARTHTQVELLQVTETCIFAQTVLDFSQVFVDGREPQVSFVQLGLPDRGVLHNRNSTPWMIHRLPVGDERQMRELRLCDA